MILFVMAQSDSLLLKFLPAFGVDLDTLISRGNRCVLLEYSAHVVKQFGGGKHNGGRTEIMYVFEKKPGIFITLCG